MKKWQLFNLKTNIIVACLVAASVRTASVALSANGKAAENDVLVMFKRGYSAKHVLRVYSLDGSIKQNISAGAGGSSTGAIGVSGNAEYAFFGNKSSNGRLDVVRIAGGKAEYLGGFNGGSNLALEKPSSMASGKGSSNGNGYIFASESVQGSCSKGQFKSVRIVDLRFTPPAASGGRYILKRIRVFEVFSSKKCFKTSPILGMQTIGNLLYVVVEEEEKKYVLRSFTAFEWKPKRSEPIVTLTKFELKSATISSPQSFTAYGTPLDGRFINIPGLVTATKDKEPGYIYGSLPSFIGISKDHTRLTDGLASFTSDNEAVQGVLTTRTGYEYCSDQVYLQGSPIICNRHDYWEKSKPDRLLAIQVVPRQRL